MNSLLAKSPYGKHKRTKTLREHTRDVLDTARAMFGTPDKPTRLCECWLRFFRIPADASKSFLSALEAACVLHDIGKANMDFQDVVRGGCDGQLLRHEHVSGLLMISEDFRNWLEQRADLDWDLVLSAVVCHHLQADPDGLAEIRTARGSLCMLREHPDLAELLEMIGEELVLPGDPPAVPAGWTTTTSPTGSWQSMTDARNALRDRLVELEIELDDDPARSRLLRAVRAALIAADSAGSALPRTEHDIVDWITGVFPAEGGDLRDAEYIRDRVIEPRVNQLRSRNRWTDWNLFQDSTAEMPRRALLLAPCGSGKTLAAWRWIERQAGAGVRHCLFLYPTRATATEGFRDYVAWAPEADAALMHGTAAYELNDLFRNPDEDDSRTGKQFETEQRLFALGYWPKRIFSATVDQFFSFLQYGYSSVCLLPVLADSVVVVDEVHSFDAAMFRGLLDFLNHFDVPVLCMTATLPENRRKKLENTPGLEVLDAYQGQFSDLRQIAEAPRYTVRQITEEQAEQRACEYLSAGKKVLWVVNTVARAQAITQRFVEDVHADSLETPGGARVYCYHSRYRLHDRKRHHANVIEAFHIGSQSEDSKGTLAVTTQVCEMGLDLDADVLITETAPVTSLIQRMGRCNRAHKPRSGAGEVLVYEPESSAPYKEMTDLVGVPEFMTELAAKKSVSQADLEAALRRVPKPKEQAKPACQFLGSGPFAFSGVDTFRDIEEFTVPAVLASDLGDVVGCLLQKQPIDGHVVPVPKWIRNFDLPKPAELPWYLCVAPSKHYLPNFGFFNEEVAQGDPPPCPRPNPLWIV